MRCVCVCVCIEEGEREDWGEDMDKGGMSVVTNNNNKTRKIDVRVRDRVLNL